MKVKVFLIVIFALALVSVGCQQEFSPTGPSLDAVQDIGEHRDARAVSQGSLVPSGKPNFSGSSNSSHNRSENHSNNKAKSEFINKIRTSNGELAADILPQKWNVNWTESVEDLKVKIFGEGFETITPESVSLSNGSLSLTQTGFEIGDVFLQVTFAKRDAIILVDNPVPNAPYEMLVFGTLVGDIPFVLSNTIFFSRNIKMGDMAAEIRPGKWNIAWTDSQDDVSVKISGLGFLEVVFSSIWMSGPNGGIQPYSFELGGTYFAALFLQKDAIGLLENPKRDETYEIGIAFTSGVTPYSMSYTITINGSKKSGDYAVKISPDKWNVNWVDSTDELIVKISGGDPTAVEAGSVTMTGPTGTVISPSDTEIEDENFHAKFIRKEAMGLIDSPESGNSYTVTINFTAGLQALSFDYSILVNGKKK